MSSLSTSGQRAAVMSLGWHRAGEANWITGRIAPVLPPIRKINLPPLTPSGVITQAMAERIDASLELQRDVYEARRIELLLTTGEVLP